ncbi:MAG TPA: Mpo1-like protein [Usitatibacter sp.]|jgi:uncharacterized membrane protein YGL010W|nr:Mpo1-like protein [Usitatibacter sp.]
MKTVGQNLTQYAAYHRDRRNIATHFLGVPMIQFSVVAALALVDIPAGGMTLTAGALFAAASALYYLRQDLAMGTAMAVLLFVFCAVASEIEGRFGKGTALALYAGLFVVGWIIQFVGHRFEGLKPAFFDDLMQLMVGPLFVCAEAFFMLGAKRALRESIEARVGPTVARRDGRALPLEPDLRRGAR